MPEFCSAEIEVLRDVAKGRLKVTKTVPANQLAVGTRIYMIWDDGKGYTPGTIVSVTQEAIGVKVDDSEKERFWRVEGYNIYVFTPGITKVVGFERSNLVGKMYRRDGAVRMVIAQSDSGVILGGFGIISTTELAEWEEVVQ